MKPYTLIAIVFLFQINGFAQYTYFNQVYSGLENYGTLQNSVFNIQSGYLSIGAHAAGGIMCREVDFEGTETLFHYDYHPLAMTSAGNLLSENCIFDSIDSYYIQNAAINEFQWAKPYISKLNTELDTVWNWLPDWEMGAGENFLPWAMTQLDNGNLLSVAMARYGDIGGADDADSLGLRYTQVSPEGIEVSSHVAIYPDNVSCSELEVYAVRQLQDNLLVMGRAVPNCLGDYQNVILKTTMEGEILDSFYWGNPDGCREFRFAARLLETGLLVFSYPRCVEYISSAQTQHEQHLMYFDPVSMQSISDVTIPIDEMNQYVASVHAESMVQASDNGYAIAFDFDDINAADFPYLTPRIFKVNDSGELQWYNEYVSGLSTYTEFLFDIENAPDGGYILTGLVELTPLYSQRHWMLKIDSCGYEQAGFCIPDVVVENEDNEVKLWPNPAHHVLKAQLPTTTESVSITDATGRMVFTEKVYHPSRQWNIRDLERGVYILTVYLEDGRALQQRFVKE